MRTATAADVSAITALYAAYDLVEFGQQELDEDDVATALRGEDVDTWLVEEDGTVVGFASVAGNGESETVVAPGRDALQAELLVRVVQRAFERGITRLEHWAGRDEQGAARLLAQAGFAHVRTAWLLARVLEGSEQFPAWPPGVGLRPFELDRDG